MIDKVDLLKFVKDGNTISDIRYRSYILFSYDVINSARKLLEDVMKSKLGGSSLSSKLKDTDYDLLAYHVFNLLCNFTINQSSDVSVDEPKEDGVVELSDYSKESAKDYISANYFFLHEHNKDMLTDFYNAMEGYRNHVFKNISTPHQEETVEIDGSFSSLTNLLDGSEEKIPEIVRVLVKNILIKNGEVEEASKKLDSAKNGVDKDKRTLSMIMSKFLKEDDICIDDYRIQNSNKVTGEGIKITKIKRIG